MAKQAVNLGTSANDGTGDPLRSAFDKVNDNTDELYNLLGDGSTLSISGDVSISAGAVTIANDAVENAMIADDAVDTAQIADDAITSALIADDAVGSAQIANDAVDHDRLSGAYTATQAITTTSGTINLDASSYAVFRLTSDLTGATTLNIQNMKEGQAIDITVSGSQTITFSSDDTTETFNKVGSTDYDGAEDNHIQVICLEDTDSGAIYNYTIGTYTSDTTP